MEKKNVCPANLPSKLSFRTYRFQLTCQWISQSVSFPGWLIIVGILITYNGISMKILKLELSLGVLSSWCLMSRTWRGAGSVALAPPAPDTAREDVPPCPTMPPPITGTPSRAGKHLISPASGHQTLAHRPIWPSSCSCKWSSLEHRHALTHCLFFKTNGRVE